jgi:hypothetical protein
MSTKHHYKRRLPHIQEPNAVLFNTFRLAGSLPGIVIAESVGDALGFSHLDPELGGPSWLANERVAQVVYDRIRLEDGHSFPLDGFCIMPNHVHLVCQPLQDRR